MTVIFQEMRKLKISHLLPLICNFILFRVLVSLIEPNYSLAFGYDWASDGKEQISLLFTPLIQCET
jgi:hypothetical protein